MYINSKKEGDYLEQCYICKQYNYCETHHIFNGSNRKKSEEYGSLIRVCRKCHTEIHRNYELRSELKKQAQEKIMEENKWNIDNFRQVFYKNYIT